MTIPMSIIAVSVASSMFVGGVSYESPVIMQFENARTKPVCKDQQIKSEPVLTEIPMFGSNIEHIFYKGDELISQIENFHAMPGDWDGDGTVLPSEDTFSAAREFILNLPAGLPFPIAMLTSLGDIEFYWDSASGYADMSFDVSGVASLFGRNAFGEEFFFDNIQNKTREYILKAPSLAIIAPHAS